MEALQRLFAGSWEHVAGDQDIARAAAAELSADAMRRSHDAARGVIDALVQRGRADEAFRTDVPPEWLTSSLLALIHSTADDVRSGSLQPDRAGELLVETIPRLFAPGPRA
jgi:hypothetical protein